MNRKLSRAAALMLVLVMALSVMTMAGAATVKYAKTEVNVRSGPGTNYAVLGYLEKGQAVTATGTVVGKWTQIQYSKYEIGYVSSTYLTSTRPGSSANTQVCVPSATKLKVCSDCGDIYYATTDLNVRSGPGTKYSIVGALAKNQQVTRIGKSGNWYKLLTTDGSVAYASASYLKLYKESTADKTDKTETASGFYYATTGLNVRKGPGTNYKIVDDLEKGEMVTYLGKSGNWYKVRTARGVVGYCYKSYMSAAAVKPAKPVKPGNNYCTQCGVLVCNSEGCFINGGVCTNNKYYCGSCYGYNWNCPTTSCGNVSFKVGELYKVRYGTMLYSTASKSGTATHTLLNGTKVVVLSGTANAGWLRVKVYDCGCYGYIPAGALA